MGLRETLNRNPGLTTAATAFIIILALVVAVLSFMRAKRSPSGPSDRVWYSDDDGNTWFPDDRNRVPPFDHKGKPAVRAYLFTCDGGKTKFVGWLERYTPEAAKQLEAQRAKGGGSGFRLENEDRQGVEVKKPKTGDKAWVKQSDAAAAVILDVKCPDGTVETLELVPDP